MEILRNGRDARLFGTLLGQLVEQGFIATQGKPFGNSLEELRRVRLSAAGIELDS
jgi:hypothetical protein